MRAYTGYVGAGAIASLTLPPIGFVPAIFLLAWPAYHLAQARTQQQAFWVAGAMGFGWFVASTHWTAHSLLVGDAEFRYLLPLAAIGIPLILSLFWAVAGAFAWQVSASRLGRLMWMITALSLAEFGRGFIATGFPWNAPGYAFSVTLAALQPASWIGLYGLNLFAIGAALAPALWFVGNKRAALSAVILPVLLVGGGMVRLMMADPFIESDGGSVGGSGETTHKIVRLVQPNINQEDKWDRTKQRQHLADLVTLSMDQKPVPQLIVWPETAFTGFLDRDAALLQRVATAATPFDGSLITGLLRIGGETNLYNSAVLIDGNGEVQQIYDKRRLVPFGEFAPFRNWLPFVDVIAGPQDFSAGQAHQLFDVPGYGLVQMSICYESIFPGEVIIGDRRPDLIVNITNDGWFGRTLGPWQHLAQVRMRAVEEGIPVIRVANTGVSAAFDAFGRVITDVDHGERGFVDARIPIKPELAPNSITGPITGPITDSDSGSVIAGSIMTSGTIFSQYHHWIFLILVLASAIMAWRLDAKDMFGQ